MFVPRHRTPTEVTRVKGLFDSGLSDREIADQTDISRSTIQRWRTGMIPRRGQHDLPTRWRPPNPASYSYLLGIYLGDGYISHVPQSPVLEISLDSKYPKIVTECTMAIWLALGVQPRVATRRTPTGESIRLTAGSPLLPLAFPQHGGGKKHERPIVLAVWQQQVVDDCPEQFLRGLVHSDGSRVVNRFRIDLADERRQYAYARYFFTNLSADIRAMFCAACDRLEIRWTQSSYKNISVSERRSVGLLDSFIGPKN
jgi:hypothetical protein